MPRIPLNQHLLEKDINRSNPPQQSITTRKTIPFWVDSSHMVSTLENEEKSNGKSFGIEAC